MAAPRIHETPSRRALFDPQKKKIAALIESTLKQWTQIQKAKLAMGAAFDRGDCFFDSIAQGVNEIPDRKPETLVSLRKLCSDYAKELDSKSSENHWLKQKINEDDLAGGLVSYEEYLENIEFSQSMLDEKVYSASKEKPLSFAYAIWGRPHIEGIILCQKLNIKIHCIELIEIDADTMAVNHLLVTPSGCRSVYEEDINYDDPEMVHLIVHHAHFVPFLRKMPALNVTSSQQSTAQILNMCKEAKDTTSNPADEKSELTTKQPILESDFGLRSSINARLKIKDAELEPSHRSSPSP